jgi:3-hydroxyacyl-CoA dehydrogenase
VAKSAAEAKEHGFLRPSDGITMNRDRLLADAKAKALELADGYKPPVAPEFRLPGAGGKSALSMAVEGFQARGLATSYDGVVSGALADVLTGGEKDLIDIVTEEDLLALERKAFMQLVRDPRTRRASSRCSSPASRCVTDWRPAADGRPVRRYEYASL